MGGGRGAYPCADGAVEPDSAFPFLGERCVGGSRLSDLCDQFSQISAGTPYSGEAAGREYGLSGCG